VEINAAWAAHLNRCVVGHRDDCEEQSSARLVSRDGVRPKTRPLLPTCAHNPPSHGRNAISSVPSALAVSRKVALRALRQRHNRTASLRTLSSPTVRAQHIGHARGYQPTLEAEALDRAHCVGHTGSQHPRMSHMLVASVVTTPLVSPVDLLALSTRAARRADAEEKSEIQTVSNIRKYGLFSLVCLVVVALYLLTREKHTCATLDSSDVGRHTALPRLPLPPTQNTAEASQGAPTQPTSLLVAPILSCKGQGLGGGRKGETTPPTPLCDACQLQSHTPARIHTTSTHVGRERSVCAATVAPAQPATRVCARSACACSSVRWEWGELSAVGVG
jgi:hypothetical protein